MFRVAIAAILLLLVIILSLLAYTLYISSSTHQYIVYPKDGQNKSSTVKYSEPDYGDWSPLSHSAVKTALDLAKILYMGDNLVISPLSIVSALTPIYDCSYDATRAELASFLGFPLDPRGVRSDYRDSVEKLLSSIKTGEGGYELSLASSMWMRQDLSPGRECVGVLNQYYNMTIYKADFAGDWEASRLMINRWVENKTNGLIKEIIPPGGINYRTTVVIVNALYFKSAWMKPFMPVENMKFYAPEGVVEVDGMNRIDEYRYYEDSLLKAVLIPYKAPGYYMLVILPVNGSVGELLSVLDHDYISGILDASKEAMIDLTMPQFKVEKSYDMREALERLGVKTLFTPNARVNIVEGGAGYVSHVYHKVYVNVDWYGTEAAASTAVVFLESLPAVQVKLVIDRPFIFIIMHEDTRLVLFYGIVVDPSHDS